MRTAQTGDDGRAQFTGVTAGARVHAIATVDGERLESTQFEVSAAGGVRTILVAGLGLGTGGAAAPAPAPAPTRPPAGGPGLTFGNNTRFAVEFQDDTIAVFYLLEIVNGTGAPVALASPLRIDLPDDAVGTSMLEGASPLASANGPHVVITGPIPAGVTPVPIAYRIESWGAEREIAQAFPLPIDQVAIGVQRLAGLTVQSAQASAVREASLSGQAFFIANGSTLPAGTPLRVTLAGLPHKSPWPLYLALGLSALVAGAGIWLALTPARRGASVLSQLEARRLRGLAALKSLDDEYRAGTLGESAYQERRQRQVATLERIYADLDAAGATAGGGEGRVA